MKWLLKYKSLEVLSRSKRVIFLFPTVFNVNMEKWGMDPQSTVWIKNCKSQTHWKTHSIDWNKCVWEEKKSSNYSILKRPHFCISRNLKKEEIKTTFVVILLTGSRKALALWSRVRHNLLLWLADEGCRNTLNGLRKRVLKIDPWMIIWKISCQSQ